MLSRRATWPVLIALLQAMPLATGALAHPVSDDESPSSPAFVAAQRHAGDDGELAGLLPPVGGAAAGGSEWSVAGFDRAALHPVAASAAAGVDPSDAWSTALQPLSKGQSRPAGVGLSPAAAMPAPGAVPVAGEEAAAVIADLQQSLVKVIAEAVDAQMNPQGVVSFSLAGREGFYYAERDGQVSVVHGDFSLAIVGDHSGGTGPQRAVAGATQHSPAPENVNVVQQIVRLSWEIVSYPLTWVVILMLLIGKVALLLAQRRARKRRRIKRSTSSPPAGVVRTRKRIRFRIKRRTPAVGLQKP